VRLKQAREDRGMSRRTLANKSTVGESTIAFIENGNKQPRSDTIELLANALDVDTCWLGYGVGKPKKDESGEDGRAAPPQKRQ
jgi:transcriptional regulator with XRE-family HTH domain